MGRGLPDLSGDGVSALFFWVVFLAALGYLIYVGGKLYLRWLGRIVSGWFDKAL